MIFERYLEHTTEELSETMTVGLAMYYLLTEDGHDNVTPAEVRQFLRDQPVAVSQTNIVAYPSQLKRKGLFDSTDGEYILTINGRRHFENLIDLPTDDVMPRDDNFLDIAEPNSEFYRKLVDDIERSHEHRVYDATLILTRKLFENLLIEIMRGHYGVGNSLDLYYNTDRAQFKSFSIVLENFEDNIDDFRPYSLELADSEFTDKLDSFRESGNASAHSITVNVDGEIDGLSEDATEIASLLFRVKKQVAAASDKQENGDA